MTCWAQFFEHDALSVMLTRRTGERSFVGFMIITPIRRLGGLWAWP